MMVESVLARSMQVLAADLDVILDHHVAQLRDLVEASLGVGDEAESVGTDHRSRVEDAAVADDTPFVIFTPG